jgi:hypothetical protein
MRAVDDVVGCTSIIVMPFEGDLVA